MATFAQLLVVVIELALNLLKRFDASRHDALRARIAADPAGMLIDKIGGQNTDPVHATTDKLTGSDS